MTGMKQIGEIIKRKAIGVIIWLVRFRHRKGYGVHSPFAFGYITRTIYAPLPAEVKRKLQESRKEMHGITLPKPRD